MSRFGNHLGGAALEHLREDEQAPYGPFFGQLGVTFSMAFAAAGAAYATAKVGTSLSMVCIRKPDLFMKGIIPVVMASVNVIYGLVLAVIISGKINVGGTGYPVYEGFAHCAAGLVCGLSALGGGYAVGDSGFHGIQALSKQPKIFIGLVLIQAFASVLGLYGMLVGLTLLAA